jgi:glycosyltransferase involved in cell wall biosynthesis
MRLFICDPVCVLPYGHNAVALNYFKSAFADRYDMVTAFCGQEIPERVSAAYQFVPFFHHYYDDFIRIDHRAQGVVDDHIELDLGHIDHLESLATADARRLLETYEINVADTVLYPSVDFYGLVGLLNALRSLPTARQPKVLLRFIGVMETATHTYRDPVRHLANRIRAMLAAGARLSFSAETPRLAVLLSQMLDAPVLVTPYPELSEPLGVPDFSRWLVFCPGAARFDKGFLHLHDLFAAVRRSDPELEICFATQSLSVRDAEHHQNYTSRLYAIPGVEVLPPSISSQQMRRYYQRCALVLLPYDTTVYRDRGSAVLMEAACLARPTLTVAGSAFAEQVSYYGLGTVVGSLDAVPEAILGLARQKPMALYRQALHARHRFVLDVVSAYKNWFEHP